MRNSSNIQCALGGTVNRASARLSSAFRISVTSKSARNRGRWKTPWRHLRIGRAVALNLGNVLRAAGAADAALEAYEHAGLLAPGDIAAHSNQGLALKDLGRPVAALIRFRRALAVNPSAAEVHFNLGNTLRETGALEDAVAALGRAVALNPGHIRARINLGVALRDLGRSEDALAAFDAAIAMAIMRMPIGTARWLSC